MPGEHSLPNVSAQDVCLRFSLCGQNSLDWKGVCLRTYSREVGRVSNTSRRHSVPEKNLPLTQTSVLRDRAGR